ncbi:hypothetical protein U1Q18_041022 [Sarracenia purpurea var. burkii]
MYLEKPRPIDFYKEEERDMMIEVSSNGELPPHHHHRQQQHLQQQMILGDSSGEDHEVKAPKKRAETWIQEETRCLISFRREVDGLFNTSKSNKHLWDQISAKMREKGFDRSATMCTDKWRNLLKEFKKAKHQDRSSASAKMSYYKELEELLRDRGKNGSYRSPGSSKVDSYIQFSDKGLEDGNIPFGSVEASTTPKIPHSVMKDLAPSLRETGTDSDCPQEIRDAKKKAIIIHTDNHDTKGEVLLEFAIDGSRESFTEGQSANVYPQCSVSS